jgi:hypothetical protein
MTRSCCPSCRLRFSRATAATIRHCPFCAEPIQQLPPSEAMGLKLVSIDPLTGDDPAAAAQAVAVALPVPRLPPRIDGR